MVETFKNLIGLKNDVVRRIYLHLFEAIAIYFFILCMLHISQLGNKKLSKGISGHVYKYVLRL